MLHILGMALVKAMEGKKRKLKTKEGEMKFLMIVMVIRAIAALFANAGNTNKKDEIRNKNAVHPAAYNLR